MKSETFGRARSFAQFMEPHHVEAVAVAVERGWSEEEVALGLLWRAVFHFNVLKGSAHDLDDVEEELRAIIAD